MPYGQKATQNSGHLTNYSRKPSVVETKDQAVNPPYKCHYTTTKRNYFLTNSSEEKHINVYNTTCLSAYVGLIGRLFVRRMAKHKRAVRRQDES